MFKLTAILWGARIIGLVIIAGLAVGVATSEEPSEAQVSSGASYIDGSSDRQTALRLDKLNAKNTDNVYQQQVVNGWAAKDLLEVQSKQLDALGVAVANPTYVLPGETDNRPVMLLMWAVIAICWFGVTTPGAWPAALTQRSDSQPTNEPDDVAGEMIDTEKVDSVTTD